jgi:hypothetical protein
MPIHHPVQLDLEQGFSLLPIQRCLHIIAPGAADFLYFFIFARANLRKSLLLWCIEKINFSTQYFVCALLGLQA